MNPIYALENAGNRLRGPVIFFDGKMSVQDQVRFTDAHRALRSLPPEMMFMNFSRFGDIARKEKKTEEISRKRMVLVEN